MLYSLSSSCSTIGAHRVTLVKIPMINYEKDRIVITTNRIFMWSYAIRLTRTLHSGPWWPPCNFWNDIFHLTTRDHWFSGFLVSKTLYQWIFYIDLKYPCFVLVSSLSEHMCSPLVCNSFCVVHPSMIKWVHPWFLIVFVLFIRAWVSVFSPALY